MTEGWQHTIRQVFDRLDKPLPLGYSAAGIVEDVGDGITEFKPGDRVAIAGQGHANHAEVNLVPRQLACHMPDGVTFEQAAYGTVCTIALQGVRLTAPALGEFVAVIGLGLVGLIAVQLLAANRCRVIGIDPNEKRRTLGSELGLETAASLADA